MTIFRVWILIGIMLLGSGFLAASEHRPYPWEESNEYIEPTLRLNAESMGGFEDALKSYVLYTAAQNTPGTKESGVGYYYNNKEKKMKRVMFYRMATGYVRETGRAYDFAVRGTGFFVVELPGGWPAFTHDGRFELDDKGRLIMQYHRFPVLGENGYIYLNPGEFNVDENGVISQNGKIIDSFRIEWIQDTRDLMSYNQSIFHMSAENMEDPNKRVPPKYTIMQGFVDDSTITKAYIGLVPEWKNGFEANVKVSKAYLRNMSSAVQAASP